MKPHMGEWRGTGGLVLWIDIDPAAQREADDWYVDEHLPERVSVAGYRSARRYVAIDAAPKYLSVFEADTPESLASPGYLGLVSRISEQSRRLRGAFSGVVRNTFRVLASAGRARGGVIASYRLKCDRPELADAERALAGQVADLVRLPGVVAAHWLAAAPEIRARLDSVRATGQSDGIAQHVLLVEATQGAELEAVQQGPMSMGVLSQLGWRVEAYGTYQFMVEFS